jgi:hypothetical protein
MTVGLGLISLGGLALLVQPDFGVRLAGLTPAVARGLGVLCLGMVCSYVLLAWSLADGYACAVTNFIC